MNSAPGGRPTTDVSVLGTGLMGAAIVRALLRSDHSVTVWNRSPDKAAPLAAEGAAVATSAAAAFQASAVTLLVVDSYATVRSLLSDAAEAGRGGDVVNLVTGSLTEARELATWAGERAIRLLDGALLTYPGGIGGADALLFCSGDTEVWDRWAELLRTFAGAAEFLGAEPHLANALDHVTLSFLTVAQTAAFSTLAYGETLGVPREMVLRQIAATLPTIDLYLQYAVPMLESGDFRTTEATIDTWAHSSQGFAQGHRDAGLPGRVVAAAAETIRAARDSGMGRLDLAAVYSYELQATRRQ
jgi:3-hydroxyisobutyrate dehydrogenase-like beta-hydroxyacid dehydrogenase